MRSEAARTPAGGLRHHATRGRACTRRRTLVRCWSTDLTIAEFGVQHVLRSSVAFHTGHLVPGIGINNDPRFRSACSPSSTPRSPGSAAQTSPNCRSTAHTPRSTTTIATACTGHPASGHHPLQAQRSRRGPASSGCRARPARTDGPPAGDVEPLPAPSQIPSGPGPIAGRVIGVVAALRCGSNRYWQAANRADATGRGPASHRTHRRDARQRRPNRGRGADLHNNPGQSSSTRSSSPAVSAT
jgi:hypothetical protein